MEKMFTNRHLDDLQGPMRLSIDALPSGHYVLQLGNGEESVMKKLVVVVN
jgi:hypothetical protein